LSLQRVAPVVEVAGDDDGLAIRRRFQDGVDQRLRLAAPPRFEQAQVHDIAVHVGLRRLEHAMQDAALLVGMVGHVVVGLRGDGKLAQQGVAMMAMVVHGIHAIRRMVLGAGKEFMLRRFRPMLVAVVLGAIAGRIAVMLALHFLQEDDIGIEQGNRLF